MLQTIELAVAAKVNGVVITSPVIRRLLRESNNAKVPFETSDKWGEVKKCEVPKIHECLINNERDNNNKYELTNNEWVNIKYNTENTYEMTMAISLIRI